MRKETNMGINRAKNRKTNVKAKGISRVFMCLLTACLLSLGLLPLRVRADVLFEIDDSFYRAHSRECDYYYRCYTVNAPEGHAVLWESPLSSRQREVLANETSVYGNWHYTDDKGETWCAVMTGEMNRQGYDTIRGWIKTSDCLEPLDHISFQNIHGEEFVEYDPAYGEALKEVETVVLWEYPCSGIIRGEEIDAEWFRESGSFGNCWEDPQGRMWAYVGYCYGIRNTWICLDDPSNADMEADESVLQQSCIRYTAAERLPKPDRGVTGLTIGAVLGVMAVTGVLLWVFFVKKRRTGGEKHTDGENVK